MYKLSQSVCERLRAHDLAANGVQISIKTPDMRVALNIKLPLFTNKVIPLSL